MFSNICVVLDFEVNFRLHHDQSLYFFFSIGNFSHLDSQIFNILRSTSVRVVISRTRSRFMQ